MTWYVTSIQYLNYRYISKLDLASRIIIGTLLNWSNDCIPPADSNFPILMYFINILVVKSEHPVISIYNNLQIIDNVV